ncbi:MAG: aldose 1-epimerase family protein [Planctomycetales bacterium]|nr:aldose 1-epimerase family protein [Planctomycetales bacterium]
MRIELPEPICTPAPPDLSLPIAGAARAQVAAGEFQFARVLLSDGPSRNVELLIIDSGTVRVAICPTRGMGLWKANIGGLPLGWNSPVHGPVHPNHVPLGEPSGIGWLDGFDELLVRCGLQSFGAPDFNAAGQLQFPLHGRVANLPARNVYLELDADHSLLNVYGEVHETRFLQHNLRLQVQYTLAIGESQIHIQDTVTNAAATPATMQLLYHINFGAPLLEAGATLHHSAQRVVARDAHAAAGLAEWATYRPPVAGFVEQVYFTSNPAMTNGWTKALLASRQGHRGAAVHYRPQELPYFSQWKNTVAEADGYVTGLEPGTGFPNPRSFEEKQGRLVSLQPGEAKSFHLRLEALTTPPSVAKLKQEIDAHRSGPVATSDFDPQWCVAES